jgi:hypothetical protein
MNACRKASPKANALPAPGSAAPLRSYVDLEAGWRLTVVTPMRKDAPEAAWRYGQANTKTTTTQEATLGINVVIELDPSTLFGFERSVYAVTRQGLLWEESVRNLNGNETKATGPLLAIFDGKARRQEMRLLFLTRASDLNYNTAFLRAKNRAGIEELTQAVRQNPEQACTGDCVWIPPGVAVRPEKRGADGTWAPVL